jgi:hypothetical protein
MARLASRNRERLRLNVHPNRELRRCTVSGAPARGGERDREYSEAFAVHVPPERAWLLDKLGSAESSVNRGNGRKMAT